jgi:glycosyltransferase involved in cell wall biosynthesis
MLSTHNWLKTWQTKVDRFVALTDFAKAKFIEGGLPEQAIRVIPNHLSPDPGPGDGSGGYGLFVGRLSEEKGIGLLLDALSLSESHRPFLIVGSGPLSANVSQFCANNPHVQHLGYQDRDTVLALMKNAAYLVLPSLWYEGLPMAIEEAFAAGTPVIAPAIGSMNQLVSGGRDGYLVEYGSARSLATAMEQIDGNPRSVAEELRRNARRKYVSEFTLEAIMPKLDNLMAELV